MNHLIAYPLTWDDIELRANNTVGIYKIKNKIAVLSCVSYTAHIDDSKDYMQGFILTNFSTDLSKNLILAIASSKLSPLSKSLIIFLEK